MSVEQICNDIDGETEVLGEKPVPLPLYSPQIWHWLVWDRDRPSAITGLSLLSQRVFITTINNSVAEASTCTMKYFNEASVLYIFLTLDVQGINNIRLISRPIHAPNHKLEDTDTASLKTKIKLNYM